MSQQAERSEGTGVVGLRSGLEALRESPAFRGPVEPLEVGERSNDHLALIYESQAEQFDAAIPFMRQGLEDGEQCLYIADENSRTEVLEAMADRGIDVDAALDSGALSVLTKQDTYLRNGEFHPDDMIEFLEEAIADATEEFAALRVTGEMTWVFGDEPDVEDLVEYEGKLNRLLPEADGIALCQYNRERFPPEVVRDIVRTHPHLVHDNVVSHNVYYTPPEEFFGPERPDNEVDRMLQTLRERSAAKADLQDHEQFLRRQNEITSSPDRTFEEKLQALFELGCERFDLEFGAVARVDTDDDHFEVEHVGGDHDHLAVGVELPLSETYCTAATETGSTGSVSDPHAAGYDDSTVHREYGIEAYLGTHLEVEGGDDRTFFFVTPEPREAAFTDDEREFLQSMGQWVEHELETQRRERDQRALYELAADTERAFEEKLRALFELGCERFDLEIGGLARIDPETDHFEVEHVSGDHDHLVPGARADLSETYCRVLAEEETAAVTDPVADGFDGTLAHDEFGVNAYLGTRIGLDADNDRSLFFVSSEPRERGFSEAERTFNHLMGQWVQYELERQHHERELREREEHLRALVETTPECIKTVAADGTVLQMNAAGLEMVGADSAADVVDESVYDLVAPEDRDAFRQFNERVCGGERAALEFDVVGLDGTRRTMETHAAPLCRPDGRNAHVALTRDVTEQRDREAELRRTKTHFETVFEQSDDGIFVVDPEARAFVDANPAAAEMTGFERRELSSLGPRDLHPSDSAQLQAFVEDIHEQGSARCGPIDLRRQDGGDLPVEITASTMTLGGRDLVLALVRDVSERKTHERYQRELYRITADTDLATDEKIARLLDVGRDRLDLPVGMLTRDRGPNFEIEYMRGSHPTLAEGSLTPELTDNYCRQVVETGESVGVPDAEAAGWADDPLYTDFDLACYAGTQVVVGDDVRGTVCFADVEPREAFTDTERSFLDLLGQCVRYELERQQYEQELEATIDRLQQSNGRLKQFAYAASHDLQEPLRMVSSYLQLLENRYGDELDADAEEYIEFAVDGADRMRAMVDDLLAYSRVEQSDGEFEAVDCGSVLDRVADDLKLQIEESDADLTVDDLPTVVADGDQLEQLFRNLVSNAVKYSGDEPPRVEVTAERRADCWEFAVSDDGIGIDPEHTDRIFEVFKRLHHDDEYSGTGIGLSLCQEIVDNHCGDVRVESEPGEGSTFFVTLPDRSAD